MKLSYLLIIFINFLLIQSSILFGKDIKIVYKINDTIVTNYDIDYELSYLSALNKNLKNLPKKDIILSAEKSIIREIIKKNQIEKIYNIDYQRAINDTMITDLVTNFRSSLGYNDEISFKNYLAENNIDYNDLKKKFVIERFWNQLIFDKYNSLFTIDKNKIDTKVENIIKNNLEIVTYNLSEIVFSAKDEFEIDKIYLDIKESIDKVGFNETASLYSISDSAKLGGKIGWVNENQISEKIKQMIENLDQNELSEPFVTAGGIIILKLNEKKSTSIEIDKEKEIERIIQSEKNKFFNEYSLIYFKELENKAYVEKL
tara:strand:+ start:525 stop:1472 length:948 start_codon:yes stop_codon:yes gene_type:complete